MSSRKERIKAAKQYLRDADADIREELKFSNEHFPDGPVHDYAKRAKANATESSTKCQEGSTMIVYGLNFITRL